MATGLSLEERNIEPLRNMLNEKCNLTDEDLYQKITIDAVLALSGVSERLVEDIRMLEPFGNGNDKPLFADKELSIIRLNVFGKASKVTKLLLCDRFGGTIEGVFFGDSDRLLAELKRAYGEDAMRLMYQGKGNADDRRLSATYYPDINEYNGNRTLQVVVQNYSLWSRS